MVSDLSLAATRATSREDPVNDLIFGAIWRDRLRGPGSKQQEQEEGSWRRLAVAEGQDIHTEFAQFFLSCVSMRLAEGETDSTVAVGGPQDLPATSGSQ